MRKTTREVTLRTMPKGIPCELSQQVEMLEWIVGIKRKLPNLPNGGLKAKLEEDLEALLNSAEPHEVAVAALEQRLEEKTREIDRLRLMAEDDQNSSQSQHLTNPTTASRVRKFLWCCYLIILHTLAWNFLSDLSAMAPN